MFGFRISIFNRFECLYKFHTNIHAKVKQNMINIMTLTKQRSICKILRAYFEARYDLAAGAVAILERQFIFDWSVFEKYFRPHVHPCHLF